MNSNPTTLHDSVADAVDHATLPSSSGSTLRQRADHMQARAAQASESTLNYIQHDPLKAVVMAAVGGAALMWLLSLFGRRRSV